VNEIDGVADAVRRWAGEQLRGLHPLLLEGGDVAGIDGGGDGRDGHAQVEGGLCGPFAGALGAGLVEDLLDERAGNFGVGEVDHLGGDLDQKALEVVAFVPVFEDVAQLSVVQAGDVFQEVVGLGDELHITVLDAIVDHLHEVAGAFGADVGDAGAGVGGGGDFLENGFEVAVGFLVAAGHDAWAMQGAFLAAADAHAEELDAGAGKLFDTALGVGEEGIAAVDDDVAFLKMGAKFGNHAIDGWAGFDHDQDAARALEELDEFGDGLGGFGILALCQVVDEVLGLGVGAVVDGDGEAVALDVERDVPPHYFEPDDPESLLLPSHGRLVKNALSPSSRRVVAHHQVREDGGQSPPYDERPIVDVSAF
jgi:hypothetical protein